MRKVKEEKGEEEEEALAAAAVHRRRILRMAPVAPNSANRVIFRTFNLYISETHMYTRAHYATCERVYIYIYIGECIYTRAGEANNLRSKTEEERTQGKEDLANVNPLEFT